MFGKSSQRNVLIQNPFICCLVNQVKDEKTNVVEGVNRTEMSSYKTLYLMFGKSSQRNVLIQNPLFIVW